jgi:HSP20 family molecular chaperone IbpA
VTLALYSRVALAFSQRGSCPCALRAVNQIPTLKWAENRDDIFLTVDVSGVKDAKIEITKDKVTFKGVAAGKEYSFDMELAKEVDEKVCLPHFRSCAR